MKWDGNMPKISIITPIYVDVVEKIDWLDEMIQSVLNQTVVDWELILIDDKSPLSLFESIKLKNKNDKRLRWFENAKNEGPAKTRNTAVAVAESNCILPLDSDDMLANIEALEYLYDTWLMDKTKTVYGNLQIYKPSGNGFERSKVHQLAHYSFEGAMNLEFGVMPVTTMHSKEAHHKAGGWKPSLTHGREDLEYWIACGKAGFCGLKINHSTLLYRKHEQSRDYRLKFENKELRAMQHKIKDMHSDIYRGVYPMACCGGKGKESAKSSSVLSPDIISQQNQAVTKVTELQGYEEKDLEWVTYQGQKKGSFSILVRGPAGLPGDYMILGTGHCFQIHKSHHKFFSDRQHLHYKINQPDPRNQPEPARQVEPQVEPQVIEMPKPELSTLVRLDAVASESREVVPEIKEVIVEPNPPQSYSDTMAVNPAVIIEEDDPRTIEQDFIDGPQNEVMAFNPSVSANLHVSNLKLSDRMIKTLSHNHWTVEKLSMATPEKLAELPGIGIKSGQKIIDKAKNYMDDIYGKSVN
jgi:teichuronic acid biosynthesis glycosyltransferase TuaG